MENSISIIMTVYNRERYLEKAIKSVLAQTRPPNELLIWDDGSTDGSVEIALRYASCDPRVRVIAADHQGQTRSLIAAIKETTCPYFGWVDSDDILAPTALQETAAILDEYKEVGLVYTNYQVIDSHEQIISDGTRCRIPYSFDRLLVDFMIFHFRLLRREVYLKVGGLNEEFEERSRLRLMPATV